jgi:hypothetical protein
VIGSRGSSALAGDQIDSEQAEEKWIVFGALTRATRLCVVALPDDPDGRAASGRSRRPCRRRRVHRARVQASLSKGMMTWPRCVAIASSAARSSTRTIGMFEAVPLTSAAFTFWRRTGHNTSASATFEPRFPRA